MCEAIYVGATNANKEPGGHPVLPGNASAGVLGSTRLNPKRTSRPIQNYSALPSGLPSASVADWSDRGHAMSFLSRREFILLLGGAAAAWPLNARAQPGERMRRIAVVMPFPADNPEVKARMAAFGEGLRQAGWNVGHNIEIAYHWEIADAQRSRSIARELVVLAPDVILATATPAVAALKEVTHTLPIVFVMVADPVSAGLVESLSRPGGNITGFTNIEYGMAAKWLELLKRSRRE